MGKWVGDGDSTSSPSPPRIRNWVWNYPHILPEWGKSLRIPVPVGIFAIPNITPLFKRVKQLKSLLCTPSSHLLVSFEIFHMNIMLHHPCQMKVWLCALSVFALPTNNKQTYNIIQYIPCHWSNLSNNLYPSCSIPPDVRNYKPFHFAHQPTSM